MLGNNVDFNSYVQFGLVFINPITYADMYMYSNLCAVFTCMYVLCMHKSHVIQCNVRIEDIRI